MLGSVCDEIKVARADAGIPGSNACTWSNVSVFTVNTHQIEVPAVDGYTKPSTSLSSIGRIVRSLWRINVNACAWMHGGNRSRKSANRFTEGCQSTCLSSFSLVRGGRSSCLSHRLPLPTCVRATSTGAPFVVWETRFARCFSVLPRSLSHEQMGTSTVPSSVWYLRTVKTTYWGRFGFG